MKKKTVCVIGLGYIGLPTAALLANKGFSVVGVDINEEVVKTVNEGKIHIDETDLASFVKLAVSSNQLKAFNKIQKSDVYMICVPTPFLNDGDIPKPNIDFVISASKNIAPFIKSGDLIILESTSPVGTTEKVKQILVENRANLENVKIAYCPERVLPGKIMTELVKNDRVIGGLTPESSKDVANFYRQFVDGDIIETDAKTAEMCKLTENSFRDLNIAFANELSMICDNQKINVWNLINLANKHPRVNILQPGTGVGGHCIAVDPWFIISQDIKNTGLIRKARDVNNYKANWVADKIKNAAKNYEKNEFVKPKIVCLGITFKPDIDDLRESRALEVVKNLSSNGYDVSVVEPNIQSYESLSLINLSEAINRAQILCILVKHSEFLDPKIKDLLKKYRAMDFCGALH
jgi:UDP-N-acetyl-D-mannosaminuronic acid dehydrogenase